MSEIKRKTKETDIELSLEIDQKGSFDLKTGIAFFDHMLGALALHSGISISGNVKGDLEVDAHHTLEDFGIVLGTALKKELEGKIIARYGTAFVPMDEALCFASLDICNRAYIAYNLDIFNTDVGGIDAQLFEEFWRAFAFSAGITLHINCQYGRNAHHIVEASFKAVGQALRQATIIRDSGVLSTKGTL